MDASDLRRRIQDDLGRLMHQATNYDRAAAAQKHMAEQCRERAAYLQSLLQLKDDSEPSDPVTVREGDGEG